MYIDFKNDKQKFVNFLKIIIITTVLKTFITKIIQDVVQVEKNQYDLLNFIYNLCEKQPKYFTSIRIAAISGTALPFEFIDKLAINNSDLAQNQTIPKKQQL
jgi:hypothetical protein